jgi:hypothetical protein
MTSTTIHPQAGGRSSADDLVVEVGRATNCAAGRSLLREEREALVRRWFRVEPLFAHHHERTNGRTNGRTVPVIAPAGQQAS